MADKVILDTDILSEYFKGYNANVVARAAAYVREQGVFAFTSVTGGERVPDTVSPPFPHLTIRLFVWEVTRWLTHS